MWPFVADQVAWSVCRSVYHTSEPCKNGQTDRNAVWVVGSDGSNESCVRWEIQIPYVKGSNFKGIGAARCKVLRHSAVICAKITEPIELPFGLWTPLGRRKQSIVFARLRQSALMGEHITVTTCCLSV